METLYEAVSHLISITEKLRNDIESLKSCSQQNKTEWMTMEQLVEYIPTHPTGRSVYGWVRNGKIPYHKLLGSLVFKRHEIDEWMTKGVPERQK